MICIQQNTTNNCVFNKLQNNSKYKLKDFNEINKTV